MTAKLLIISSLFFVSLAYAHPNHMTFEPSLHDTPKMAQPIQANEKIHLNSKANELRHNEKTPCTEQHKSLPCKEDE